MENKNLYNKIPSDILKKINKMELENDNNEDAKYKIYVHTIPKEITQYEYDKYYVGQTYKKVQHRWSNGKGYIGQVFYLAIKKYGWENIQHNVIATKLLPPQADWLEKELIQLLDSNISHNGYNVDNGGKSTANIKSRKKISKPAYQYDLNGNFIKKWNSATEASEALGVDGVSDACSGKYRSCCGYQWTYDYVDKMPPYQEKKVNRKEYEPLYQFTPYGKLIKKHEDLHNIAGNKPRYYEHAREAAQKKSKFFDGYLWVFESQLSDELLKQLTDIYLHRVKPVCMYSLDGEYIQTFENAKEAAIYMHKNIETIRLACRAGHFSGDYLWYYEYDCGLDHQNVEPYKYIGVPVLQYDTEWNFIKKWKSAYSAEKQYGGGIKYACEHNHYLYGYNWKFED